MIASVEVRSSGSMDTHGLDSRNIIAKRVIGMACLIRWTHDASSSDNSWSTCTQNGFRNGASHVWLE